MASLLVSCLVREAGMKAKASVGEVEKNCAAHRIVTPHTAVNAGPARIVF